MIKIKGDLEGLHATGKATQNYNIVVFFDATDHNLNTDGISIFSQYYFQELTDEGIDIIFDEINQAPEPRIIADSNIYLTSLGGKLKEIPAESSTYPFRQAE